MLVPPLILLADDLGVVLSPTTERAGVTSFVGDGLLVVPVVLTNGLLGDGARFVVIVLVAASFGVRGDAVLRLPVTACLSGRF